MQNIDWSAIANNYIEMQETGKQCIITLPEIVKNNTIYCDGGEYFLYGLDLDDKEITLLNVKEQLFGDFADEIIYDERGDTFSLSADSNHEAVYHPEYIDQIVTAILDKQKWVQCHYVEIQYSDEEDMNRMYLCKVGEHPQLDEDEVETGRFLQFDVNSQKFVYVN